LRITQNIDVLAYTKNILITQHYKLDNAKLQSAEVMQVELPQNPNISVRSQDNDIGMVACSESGCKMEIFTGTENAIELQLQRKLTVVWLLLK